MKPRYGEPGQGQRRRGTEWELSAVQGWARPSPSACLPQSLPQLTTELASHFILLISQPFLGFVSSSVTDRRWQAG